MEIVKKITSKFSKILVIVLCFFSLCLLIITTSNLYDSGGLKFEHYKKGTISNQYKLSQLNHIETWMTFDYLNVIFKLPKNYLQETFDITDKRYPNIRVDHYAKRHDINPSIFLTKIKLTIINLNHLN